MEERVAELERELLETRYNLQMVMKHLGLTPGMITTAPNTDRDPPAISERVTLPAEHVTMPAPESVPVESNGVGSIYVSVDLDPTGFNRQNG